MTTRRLLGIPVHSVTLDEAVERIRRALSQGVRGYVVTPNVDHLMRYHRNPRFRAAYNSAMLHVADGMPLVVASRLLGSPLPQRVAGADLLPALCSMATREGFSVFLLGGHDGVAEEASRRLRARFPGLKIAGTHTPPAQFGSDPRHGTAAVRAVNAARPDLLFVGLGSPKQELWVHQNWRRLNARIAVCCGAAIDYAAGARSRAPRWVQRFALEWAWRLLQEPRRLWRRYLVDDIPFFSLLFREWWRVRVRKMIG